MDGLVYRNNIGRVQHIDGEGIADCDILVEEIMATREAVLITVQKRLLNVIIENVFQLPVRTTTGDIKFRNSSILEC